MKTRLVFAIVLLFTITIVPVSLQSVQGASQAAANPVYLPIVTGNNVSLLSFFSPVPINITPQPLNGQLFLVVDSTGQAHLFWGNGAIYHTVFKDTGFTTPDQTRLPEGGAQLIKQPVAGKNNDIHMVFSGAVPIGAPYYIVYQKWDGTKWGPQTNIVSGATTRDITGAVRLNSQGNPMVFGRVEGILDPYYETQYRNYNYLEWSGSGFGPVQTFGSKFTYGQTEAPYIDNNGGLRLYASVYNNKTGNYEFHYAYWKNGSWPVPDQKITQPTTSIDASSGLMDNQNNLQFLSLGPNGSISSLSHQCLHSNLVYDPINVISGSDYVRSDAWSLDDTGSPIIAYRTDTNLTVQMWNGCQMARQVSFVLPTLPANFGWGGISAVGYNQQARVACFLMGDTVGFQRSLVLCVKL